MAGWLVGWLAGWSTRSAGCLAGWPIRAPAASVPLLAQRGPFAHVTITQARIYVP